MPLDVDPEFEREMVEDGRSKVKAPAITLIVLGALTSLLGLALALPKLMGGEEWKQEKLAEARDTFEKDESMSPEDREQMLDLMETLLDGFLIPCALMAVLGLVVLLGAVSMLRLKSRGFAMLASILALIPCVGCCLGVPVGIWSLVVLMNENVREAFARSAATTNPYRP